MNQILNPLGMVSENRPAIYPATCTNGELINYVDTYAKTQIEIELAKRLSAAIDACPVETGENCQCCGAPI